MTKKPTLTNQIKQDITETHEVIAVMRGTDRALDAYDYRTGTLGTKIGIGLRVLGREFLYACLIPLKLLLIVVFNIAALPLFIGLLSLL